MKRLLKKQNTTCGFTLVEMLVSIALFTVVLTMSVGTLLVLIDANGRAQNMQLIISNLSFTLDSMTREIRTGTDWYCSHYSGASQPNIPTDNTDSQSATRNCGLSNRFGNYISILETGGSLTDGFSSDRITYYFDNDYYGQQHGAILRAIGRSGSNPETSWVPLTGSEIDIDFVELSVGGTSRYKLTGDTQQPTLTLYIRGSAGTDIQEKSFSVQTSITQRTLDL